MAEMLMNLDQVAMVRGVFAAHFILISAVLMGSWPSSAYLFYNAFLLGSLLWTLHSQYGSFELPLLASLFTNAASIILDILVMASSYSNNGSRQGWEGFALAAAIVNLILRLPTTLLLYKMYQDKGWTGPGANQYSGYESGFDAVIPGRSGGGPINSGATPDVFGTRQTNIRDTSSGYQGTQTSAGAQMGGY